MLHFNLFFFLNKPNFFNSFIFLSKHLASLLFNLSACSSFYYHVVQLNLEKGRTRQTGQSHIGGFNFQHGV